MWPFKKHIEPEYPVCICKNCFFYEDSSNNKEAKCFADVVLKKNYITGETYKTSESCRNVRLGEMVFLEYPEHYCSKYRIK